MFKLLLIFSILTTHINTRDANIGVLICDYQTGDTIEAYRPNSVIPPASVIKLFTTATVLEILGSEHQIETPITHSGYIKNGVLYGNLYIEGRGDPTLGSRHIGDPKFLEKWAQQVQAAGIKEIKGNIVADGSYFEYEATNPGWLWEDIGNYYAPGIFALSYLDNTLKIKLQSGDIGSPTTVIGTQPKIEGMEFENHVVAADISYDGAYVRGIPYSNHRYLVGKIPANRESFTIKGTLPNPGLVLANEFKKELQKIEVSVSGSVSYQALKEAQLTTRKTLFVHRSLPLKEIVRHTNYRSDNLYAEMLFRIVASRYGVPCTIKSSIRFINEYWKRKGLDLSSGRILDGCGLAPQDAISAEMFVDLLRYMYSSTEKEAFIASLPCSGESGTIKSFLKDTELHGKVYAKSGTIGGTKNFAGYIFLPDGRIWVFAVLVNSANCRSRRIQDIIEEYLLDVYKRNA